MVDHLLEITGPESQRSLDTATAQVIVARSFQRKTDACAARKG